MMHYQKGFCYKQIFNSEENSAESWALWMIKTTKNNTKKNNKLITQYNNMSLNAPKIISK